MLYPRNSELAALASRVPSRAKSVKLSAAHNQGTPGSGPRGQRKQHNLEVGQRRSFSVAERELGGGPWAERQVATTTPPRDARGLGHNKDSDKSETPRLPRALVVFGPPISPKASVE